MIEYNSAKRPCRIIIPISGQQDILRYQRGMLGILGKIELCGCEPSLTQDVKAVFHLLSHMVSANTLEQLNKTAKRNGHKKKKAIRLPGH